MQKKDIKLVLILIAIVLAVVGTSLWLKSYIDSHSVPVLNPSGFIAVKEKNLIVTSSILMLIVVVPVLLMTFFFAWRYRESNEKAKHTPDWEHNAIAEYFWWGVPFVIIIALAVITWKSSYELSPFKALESDKKPLKIQVIALQWKWLFVYPEQGIVTVNYLKFPANQPLQFEITADAPMNSFWIPALGGQIYAMPSMRSQINLIASKEGTYQGLSSNISGTGFSKMTFEAIACNQDDFASWVTKVGKINRSFGWSEYNLLVQPQVEPKKAAYVLSQPDLFEAVIMKYMAPSE